MYIWRMLHPKRRKTTVSKYIIIIADLSMHPEEPPFELLPSFQSTGVYVSKAKICQEMI